MKRDTRFDLFPVSIHLFFRRHDSVLLIRRRRTGFSDGMFSVPAGHVTQSESIFEAAIREAREEVDLEIAPQSLRVVGTMYRRSTEARIDFFIEVKCWSGEPKNNEVHKCAEVGWFPSAHLPDNTIPYVRLALQNCDQSPWFEEYALP